MSGRANQDSQRAYTVRREGRGGGKIVYNGGQTWAGGIVGNQCRAKAGYLVSENRRNSVV